MSTQELNAAVKWADINFWIMFDMLKRKGVIAEIDVQDSIANYRARVPAAQYTDIVRDKLNIMEQIYQPGIYRSPLERPPG